jgi:hypothetical protein
MSEKKMKKCGFCGKEIKDGNYTEVYINSLSFLQGKKSICVQKILVCVSQSVPLYEMNLLNPAPP